MQKPISLDNISAPARMLMSDPQRSAQVRAAMDTQLKQADAELAAASVIKVGGVEVDQRWRCAFRGKYTRVIDLVAAMKDEERQHHVFKPRGGMYYGELIYIGPQLPGESRQVYRARLRHGVKTISKR